MRQLITFYKSRIRFKIILPFAVLTLMVAITGVYLSTRLVSGSLEERFTRQLIDAGSTVADGLAQREQWHLSQLNAIAFTQGIDEAILANDREQLQTLIFPLIINNTIDRVDVVDTNGFQLLEISRLPGTSGALEDYSMTHGANLANWSIVQKVINGVIDTQGDKFVTLASLDNQDLFVTIGPVKQGNEIVGAILVSSYIRDLLQSLAYASFAEVSLYNLEGSLINTTIAVGGAEPAILNLSSEARAMLAVDGESSLKRSIVLGGREYDSIFGIFRARGQPLGFYSVALPTTFIVSQGTIARNYMIAIFTIALIFVFGIGYLTANAITGQLQHLMENAIAVANGDFTRRTQISSADEIGSLAQSLDHMTQSLANYTSDLQNRIDELVALYESSTAVTVKSGLNLEQVLQAVTTSVSQVIRGANQVVVHLLDQNGQTLMPKAVTPERSNSFSKINVPQQGAFRDLLGTAKPHVISLAQLAAYAPEGTFTTPNGVPDVVIAPLVASQETIGLLTLTFEQDVPETKSLDEATERLLGTLANQSAIAIKNAQLFEATQKAYEELRQLDDLKTQFINIAAHELRTPLGAMLGYASYVEKRVPPKLHKSMRFLSTSMLRMRTMVDAMLAIQRLDAGTAFLRLTPIDIRDVLKKVVSDYQPMAELEGHVIRVNLPDKLPVIKADAEKISLVISNLLSNAIKFTSTKGRIEVSARDYLKGILISVRDNGVGIPVEDQKQIFERFYQVPAEHLAGHGGMGIGLTIVKQLVELHEGQVWVESEVGQGSTFYFTLPKEESGDSVDASSKNANSQLYQDKEELLAEL